MRITLNGKEQKTTATTVTELLAGMKIDEAQFLAVSRNGAVVRKNEWSATRLAEDDTVDILTIVGGG
ncbi:MAG TPA: sulfur carrier protein ThiS [bacterium]|nr:sulfur carrier protein ThiS [bacterium]